MVTGSMLYFSLDEDYIVEASPRDKMWGVGMGAKNEKIRIPAEWRGSNILGWALMEARKEFKSNDRKGVHDFTADQRLIKYSLIPQSMIKMTSKCGSFL